MLLKTMKVDDLSKKMEKVYQRITHEQTFFRMKIARRKNLEHTSIFVYGFT